jgi:pimeloyl-ACP methyl ester carboxylesterase
VIEHVLSPDGTEIAYSRTGDGPALVLIHGTTADHTRWARVAPAFEARFSVYAIDRRGRGGSGDAPAYAVAREAEDIAAVVNAIGAPADVLGHSYGALCALEAAPLMPRVRRLVLYEPPIPTGMPAYSRGLPDRLQELVDRGEREEALLLFFREVVRAPESDLDVMRSLPVWQTRIALAATIPRELRVDEQYTFDAARAQGVNTPTLVMAGDASPPFLRRAAEIVDETLPDSRLVVMPGQGHVAMDTAPDLFTREVLRFLGP